MTRSPARALAQLSLALIAVGLVGVLIKGPPVDAPDPPAARARQATAVGQPAARPRAPATTQAAFAHDCPANDRFTLAGTALVDGGHRVALIRSPTASRLVAVGQRVEGHTVQAIARRNVAVLKADKRTCLKRRRSSTTTSAAARSTAAPVRSTGPHRYAIDRSWLSGRMDNLRALGKDIRVRPMRKHGRLQGFRVARVRSGGVFAQLGLKRGDVLLAANGQPLDSPNRILKLYAQLPDSDVVQLRIKRGSTTQTLDYAIE